MTRHDAVVHSDPEVLGGTPVFVGTRVPVQAFIDYLEGGHPLVDFLEDFPSVTHAQAVAALELAKDALLRTAGAVVDLRVEDDRIVMEPVPEDTLSMLLDRITPANLHGEQLADAPIGREVW
ncbi:MAG: DUF433 domain-containing protein [Polaromonas sp.]|nr:DUF433 domain-containing protein [Gemmatimonadaceae bacterium]